MIVRGLYAAAGVVLWRSRLPLFIFAVEFLGAFGIWLETRRAR